MLILTSAIRMGPISMSKAAFLLLLLLSVVICADRTRAEEYRVSPDDSDLRVLVFRSGPLARLAHNHVVSSSAVAGTIVLGDSPSGSTFDLYVPVDSFVVDDPDIRAEEGQAFSAKVSAKDRAGTRRNMMGKKLLQADLFNDIRVVSQRISGDYPDVSVEAGITIRDEQHIVRLPALVERYDDRIQVTGSVAIAHSELGLRPFTAALGAMRVGEMMTVKYRIVAVPTPGNGQ
jgi:polyisoprenoid-binding protein YceI